MLTLPCCCRAPHKVCLSTSLGCLPPAAGASSALVPQQHSTEGESICAFSAAGSLSRTLISSQGLGLLLRLGR